MARLQWEQVRAPDLSIRDLAIAGQQVSSGFDRLASMFQQRYQQQRQEATDKAVAGILATTDPSQLMNVDPSQFGENVDTRAVLEATNQQRRGLLVEADTREDLLNKQALSQFGPEISQGMEAYYAGDETAKAALVTRAAEDPMFARAMGAYTEQFFDAFTTGVDDRQQALEHRDLVADRATGRNLEERRLALEGSRISLTREGMEFERAQRADAEAGAQYGQRLLSQIGEMTPEAAQEYVLKDPRFNSGSSAFQGALLDVVTARQPVLSARAEARFLAEETVPGGPETAGLRDMARLSDDLREKVDAVSTVDLLAERGPFGTKAAAKSAYDSLRAEGYTDADITAAIRSTGMQASWFWRVPGQLGEGYSTEMDTLREALKGMADQRAVDAAVRRRVRARQSGYGTD